MSERPSSRKSPSFSGTLATLLLRRVRAAPWPLFVEAEKESEQNVYFRQGEKAPLSTPLRRGFFLWGLGGREAPQAAQVSEQYLELVNFFIRPPRDVYADEDLGPPLFRLAGKKFRRVGKFERLRETRCLQRRC